MRLVAEGCLTRRFPIYKPGDSNAKPTGGLRQICYKLKNGEASWILRPTSVLQFDQLALERTDSEQSSYVYQPNRSCSSCQERWRSIRVMR